MTPALPRPIADYVEANAQLDVDGMLQTPTGPGLGITLNREAIARFAPR